MKPDTRPIEILLVEDNAGDARLVRETFQNGQGRQRLSIVRDGIEALKYLRRQNGYREAPRPDLILLDLHLPGKSGLEVLRAIKEDAELGRIPVVILTTSGDGDDVRTCYDLQANCYVRKREGLEEYRKALQCTRAFWYEVVKLPPGE
jgi:CheY-like chemotaxis protein